MPTDRAPKVFLFGTPRIEIDGQPVHLERQKSIALLAYLTVTQRTHSREWVATLLWPDVSTSRTQLRKSLAEIRQKLGDDWLHVTWDEVGIKGGALWSDVGELLRVSVSFARGELASMLDTDFLLNLYPQHLLNGFSLRDAPDFDDWQRVEELNLCARYERLVDYAVSQFIQLNHLHPALTLASHWVKINPFNEHARRQLIRLYAWTNQRGAALREYQFLRSSIWENHHAQPEPETIELYQQLQNGMPTARVQRQPSHLPMLSPLIGRHREQMLLIQMVDDGARLITITGPGGVGKTHLAVATAHALETRFADGCYLVALESSSNPRSLIAAIAQALSIPTRIDRDLPSVVYDHLRTRHILIVLDSIHHVEHAQSVIQAILHHAPHVVLLLTSYQALDMNSEYCFALGGLTVGDDDQQAQQSAVQLFVQGAKRVLPHFQLTAQNHGDVSRICRLVEGIPLGILLASAWCSVLAPNEIADEIAANFDFLQVSHRDIPERHQSLRAVFESAWVWLTADEQRALMNLSIFPESFTRKAAEQIALVRLPTLKALTSKALISFTPSRQRYALHDMSRQYAGEKLLAAGGQAELRERYHRFYAQYLTERYQALRGHLKETAWREIESEFIHIHAAWRGALAENDFHLILQMMEPLHLFLLSRGWELGLLLFDEARQVAAVSLKSRRIYYKLLMRFFPSDLGMAHWLRELHAAMEMATAEQDMSEVAYLHGEFGWYFLISGDYAEARTHFLQAESYYRSVEDSFTLAVILRGNAYTAIALGDFRAAEQHTKESLRLRRTIGDHEGEHETLMLQAELALLVGQIDKAGECYQSVYTYFHSYYPDVQALIRSYSMGWYWVFSQQFDQAHAFADQVLRSLDGEQAAVVVCTAHAVKLAAYSLQDQRAAVQAEMEAVEDLLRVHPIWESTSNSAMRFMIDLSLLLGYASLGQRDAAFSLIRTLAKSGRMHQAVYFTWLAPVLAGFAAQRGHIALAQSIRLFHQGSFLRDAGWTTHLVELSPQARHDSPDVSVRQTVQELADAIITLSLQPG